MARAHRSTHARTHGNRAGSAAPALVALLLAMVAACGAPQTGGSSAGASTATSSGSSSGSRPSSGASSGSSTSSAAPVSAVGRRCGEPDNPAAKSFELHGPSGARLAAVDVGTGSTYAVLLHQTDGGALCGWWPYADWLAATQRVHVVLIDLCGYGRSRCHDDVFGGDQVAQARIAVSYARSHGARRVTVVGASMGGSVALDTAVAARAAAVVDLSGPAVWPPLSAARTAPKLTMPTLIAISSGYDASDAAALKKAFVDIPSSTKMFVDAPAGHGWDLLSDLVNGTRTWTPLAATVAGWVRGTYR